MQNVQVINIEEDGVFEGETTIAVTLKRGDVTIKCEGIVDWEEGDDDDMQSIFEDWLQQVEYGAEGIAILS